MKIQIALLHVGKMSVQTCQVLMELQRQSEHELDFVFPSHVPGESNRNRLVRDFLETDNEYLLMIDDDNPPMKNPLDLLIHKKDIFALPTPVFKQDAGGMCWMVGKNFGTVEDPDYRAYKASGTGLVEVDFVGSGCLLVHRRVFEAIKAPFMRQWDENGVAQRGQDIMFSQRATQAGFKMWVHWDYVCNHHKVVDLINFIT